MPKTNKTLEQRFLNKVLKTDSCWLWLGSKNDYNYGRFKFDNKVGMAHKFSYQFYIGAINEGLYVLHKCDKPDCVNPNHLFLGTQKDNMADMIAKNRGNAPKGSRNHFANLVESQVIDIRNAIQNGARNCDLAREYNVDITCIEKIKYRKTWKHL